MRICVLTASASRSAGGLFYSVRSLSKQLEKISGVSVVVWAISGDEVQEDLDAWAPLKVRLFDRTVSGKYGFSFSMLMAMLTARVDVVYLNGLWGFPSLAAMLATFRGVPVVISPRGMLDPWIIGRHNSIKRIYYSLIERTLLRRAYAINSLSQAESNAVSALGFGSKSVKIPNGVEVGSLAPAKLGGRKRLIYIGRYDEKKGLLEFLDAWKCVRPDIRASWEVRTFGWGDALYESRLRARVDQHGLGSEWVVGGPVYADVKAHELAGADAFFLPTKGEGLPMAVLEAWAAGLPVLTTVHANLPEGFEADAARDLGEFGEWPVAIEDFLSLSKEELTQCGVAGFELVKARFSWPQIASSYKKLFAMAVAGVLVRSSGDGHGAA